VQTSNTGNSDSLGGLDSFNSFKNSPYKSIKHSTYFNVYDDLFSRFKQQPITFVEVGVLGGGSLFMWRDFFGPQARIIGIDLNPNARKWIDFGFDIYIGDQSKSDFWKHFFHQVGEIDILLDDGGHTYLQQIVTVREVLPFIKHQGILVVEDTHSSYMQGFGPKKYSFINFAKREIDKVNYSSNQLGGKKNESHLYNIGFYESIVAFHIDRNKTRIKSEFVSNERFDDGAEDYRNKSKPLSSWIDIMRIRLSFIKKIPGVNFITIILSEVVRFFSSTLITSSLRRHFRN
jgi:hypothetical protein